MANLMFYDDETANANQMICQVGFCITDQRGKVLESYQTLVNPDADFDYHCVRVHGIRPQDVADAPTFDIIASTVLNERLHDCILIAHGAKSADLHHLAKTYRACGITMPTVRVVDTIDLARKIPGLKRFGLATLCERYHVPCEGHHDALADAEMLRRVFWPLVKEVGTPKAFVAVDKARAAQALRLPADTQIKIV